MKIICPFCHAQIDSKEDKPDIIQQVLGNTYICHKVLCTNKDKHPDHNNVTIVFEPEEEKNEIQNTKQASDIRCKGSK